jgi:hypothetical protein
MVWRVLEDVNCAEQPDGTACWLSAAKAVLDAINIKCGSVAELRDKYKGRSQQEVGEYSVTAGVGNPTTVLKDFGVDYEQEKDQPTPWGPSDEDRLFARLNDAIIKKVPVICSIKSPQYKHFHHAVVVKGTNDTMREVLFTDPANGQMRSVRMSKLISTGFRYKKDSLVNLKTGAKKNRYDLLPDAWAYAYRFTFPCPLACRI